MKTSTSFLLILSLLLIVACTSEESTSTNTNDEFNIYTFKYNQEQNSEFDSKLIGLDINDGSEVIVTEFEPNTKIHGFVVNEISNEMIGVTNKSYSSQYLNKLYFIDLEDGSYSTLELDNSSSSIYYDDLVLDEEGNIFAFKSNYNQYTGIPHKIVQINREDGSETSIANFNEGVFLDDLNYEQSNKVFCLRSSFLIEIDLNNGDHSGTNLNTDYSYSGLVKNNYNEYFAFKEKRDQDSNLNPEIIRIEESSGDETIIQTLNEGIRLRGIAYDNLTNTILGIGNENHLYKIDANNGIMTTIPLDNTVGVKYEEIIVK